MDHLNSLVNDSLQVISKQVLDQSISLANRGDDCTDSTKEGLVLKEQLIVGQAMDGQANGQAISSHLNSQISNQINNQINSQLSNQISSQLTQINNTLNDLNANLSINSNISTSISPDIHLNDGAANSPTININLNINNITNGQTAVVPSSSGKNDFVIISVLKKQGVTKTKCANDATKKFASPTASGRATRA